MSHYHYITPLEELEREIHALHHLHTNPIDNLIDKIIAISHSVPHK